MNNVLFPSFDKTLIKTKEWIKELQKDLNIDSEERAYISLRAVLHALRDRLTIDESAELAAQLPMLIRGFYYEGYRPAGKPLKMDKDEFIDHVRIEITDDLDPEYIIKCVFIVLERKITQGEIKDMKGNLPDDILELWPIRGVLGAEDETGKADMQE